MSSKDRNEILKELLENLESLYRSPETISYEMKQHIFALEELLVQMLRRGHQEQMNRTTPLAEEEVAEIVDTLLHRNPEDSHKLLSALDHNVLREVMDVYNSIRTMENPVKVEVPQVLLNLTAHSRKSEPEKVPSLILKLASDGISLIKSTLQGVSVFDEPAVSVRSTAAPARPRVSVRQPVQSNEDISIEYQIVRESEDELMLSMLLPRVTGQTRVNLRMDGKIIASEVVTPELSRVSFSRLKEGYYDIEVKGALENHFNILIQGE